MIYGHAMITNNFFLFMSDEIANYHMYNKSVRLSLERKTLEEPTIIFIKKKTAITQLHQTNNVEKNNVKLVSIYRINSYSHYFLLLTILISYEAIWKGGIYLNDCYVRRLYLLSCEDNCPCVQSHKMKKGKIHIEKEYSNEKWWLCRETVTIKCIKYLAFDWSGAYSIVNDRFQRIFYRILKVV